MSLYTVVTNRTLPHFLLVSQLTQITKINETFTNKWSNNKDFEKGLYQKINWCNG